MGGLCGDWLVAFVAIGGWLGVEFVVGLLWGSFLGGVGGRFGGMRVSRFDDRCVGFVYWFVCWVIVVCVLDG